MKLRRRRLAPAQPVVELPDLDYKQLDRLVTHKRRARKLPNSAIIQQKSVSVKSAATYISEDGEIVAKQIRQAQKHLSEEEVAQIVLAYQGGKSANVLAREYGCNRKAICDHLKKNGVTVSRSKISSEETVRYIIALYESNQQMKEIADQYGVSESAINRLLHANGVRIRSRWDYER